MTEFAIFTLAAHMASFGDLAGHKHRGTTSYPGRSAVLGLVGAALGVRREDRTGLQLLEGMSVAVSVICPGQPLRDFHTVQTVPSAKAKRPATRAAALAEAGRGVNTVITLRDYRTDVLFGVALWGDVWPLSEIVASLEQPIFSLYLGRKSCPLAAPVAPHIVQADDPPEALEQITLPPWHNSQSASLIASDPMVGLVPDRTEIRHDQAVDRTLWHFAARKVMILEGLK